MFDGIGEYISFPFSVFPGVLLRPQNDSLTPLHPVYPIYHFVEPLHFLELFSVNVEEVLLDGTVSRSVIISILDVATFNIDSLWNYQIRYNSNIFSFLCTPHIPYPGVLQCQIDYQLAILFHDRQYISRHQHKLYIYVKSSKMMNFGCEN